MQEGRRWRGSRTEAVVHGPFSQSSNRAERDRRVHCYGSDRGGARADRVRFRRDRTGTAVRPPCARQRAVVCRRICMLPRLRGDARGVGDRHPARHDAASRHWFEGFRRGALHDRPRPAGRRRTSVRFDS